jgi:hypothetical protein
LKNLCRLTYFPPFSSVHCVCPPSLHTHLNHIVLDVVWPPFPRSTPFLLLPPGFPSSASAHSKSLFLLTRPGRLYNGNKHVLNSICSWFPESNFDLLLSFADGLFELCNWHLRKAQEWKRIKDHHHKIQKWT